MQKLRRIVAKCRAGLIRYCRYVTVEPIIFFNFLSLALYSVSQHAVIYKAVCVQYFKAYDPSINCDDLHSDPALEDKVQKSASSWAMLLSLCYMIPAVPADMFLGAWSDRNGRKVSILLGFAGMIFAALPLILVSAAPAHVPIYILAFSNTVAGLTGYIAIITISCLAYLTDIVRDKDTLIYRMTLVSISRSVSEVLGSFLLGKLLKVLKPSFAVLLAQCVLVVGFFYTLARIEPLSPEEMRKKYITKLEKIPVENTVDGGQQLSVNDGHQKPVTDLVAKTPAPASKPPNAPFSELIQTWRYVCQLYKEVWRTLVKPRQNHKRSYMALTIFIFFCYMMAELGLYMGPILSLYVFHRPFYWSPANLGTFKGVQHVFALAANILGACVMKKFLKGREILVIIFALISGILHLTVTGVAYTSWMMYLAAAVGCFNTLSVASLKSFLARQVEADEVGKALAANGIATDLAYVCTMLIFNNVYRATVSFYSGSAFLLGAFVMLVCFFVALWMMFDSKKQTRNSKKEISFGGGEQKKSLDESEMKETATPDLVMTSTEETTVAKV